jgi:F0F1-type ATP synthase assembly protein I
METREPNEHEPSETLSGADEGLRPETNAYLDQDDKESRTDEPFILQNTAYSPESVEETARRSGLAWSAGIVFFTSIAFMLFLGWIADILLGSSPWGLVGGIVLGAVIGFIQFFRISSQIFNKPSRQSPSKTLFKDGDNDN